MEELVWTEHLDLMTVFVPCSTLDHIVMVRKRINSSDTLSISHIKFILILNLSANSHVMAIWPQTISTLKCLQMFVTDCGNFVALTINGLKTSKVCFNTLLLTELLEKTEMDRK